MTTLSQGRLKSILHYCSDSGVFTWKRRPRSYFVSDLSMSMFNKRYAGMEAGSVNAKGYLKIMIDPCLYSAHRLAWLYVYGEFPLGQIDHINQDKQDNRISNLRLATNIQNCRNQSLSRNNSSGISGVHFSKECQRWISRINNGNGRVYLGCFDSLFNAVCARKSAELEYDYHENHGMAKCL